MKRLYLNNFRGFSEQFIEIRDVNFLVGENSSGKSSVLMVLNSISTSGFWFNLDFHSGDAQVYSFEDMVSVEAQDKTFFQIGIFSDEDEEISYLFEFRNSNGKPTISSGIIEIEDSLFVFYHEKEQVKFKIVPHKKLSLEMLKPFSENEKHNLKTLPITTKILTPVTLLQMCEHAINNKNGPRKGFMLSLHFTPIAPIRSKPKKTYDEPGTVENPEGDHIPYEIRRILKTNSDFSSKLNNFGNQSGMFKKIDIKEYGVEDDTPFRMNFVLNKRPINIVNIGYGVSQILPILYNMYTHSRNNIGITIQQPEVHLHPKAQAALGDVFFDLSIGKKRKKLIIETHSDYIIDRFRQKQRKSRDKSSVHVLFFLREKGTNRIFPINIDENGNYDPNQPKEFREFFIKEEMENLGLES